MAKFDRFIQNKILRRSRQKQVANLINRLPAGSILDIGCMDLSLSKFLSNKFQYTGVDPSPLADKDKLKKGTIEELGNEKFDIVIATEVLEHLTDPIFAIQKIKAIARKFIVISVPNEPFFSLFRLFVPAKEHLWTIFPQTLKKYLGNPIFEKRICFNRHYLALWKL